MADMDELEREIGELVDGLSRIVVHRDPPAAVHLDATAALAERLARELKLTPQATFRAATAGRLHDLGMLAISAEIIAKPGRPSRQEQRELEMHPIYGASILEGFGKLRQFAEIIRAHHERIDGKGYPYGLPEYDIPIEAKIVSVAEAFHAITTDHPYAAARTPQRALAEIYRYRGAQFDAAVVDALCRLMRWEPTAVDGEEQSPAAG
jgi:HD-GYP domain-containing protein (c-di-GMP phosphodiesterase class II)